MDDLGMTTNDFATAISILFGEFDGTLGESITY
jgi:hypothetical protein